jgi:hypothetical protein
MLRSSSKRNSLVVISFLHSGKADGCPHHAHADEKHADHYIARNYFYEGANTPDKTCYDVNHRFLHCLKWLETRAGAAHELITNHFTKSLLRCIGAKIKSDFAQRSIFILA